ncbi:hypothetical protein [Streptomyces sp. NPDC051677]|uniref:hypothetical protein n=1 Tax=Streptomyces sp. NPDC051677 TaxID=3365669 RepID=UPI0037CD192D
MRASTASDAQAELAPHRRTSATFALLTCAFLAMLGGTALPRSIEQIGSADNRYVWLVTVYLLTSSVKVPSTAVSPTRYGRRRLLLGELTSFLLGSLACGLARSTDQTGREHAGTAFRAGA